MIRQKIYRTLCLGIFFVTMVSGSAAAQSLASGQSFSPPIGRLIFGLLLSFAVAVLIALLIRRLKTGYGKFPAIKLSKKAPFGRGAKISITETRRLSAHGEICLIEHEHKEYLVVLSAGQSNVLNIRDLPIDEPDDV